LAAWHLRRRRKLKKRLQEKATRELEMKIVI
jgi:hypothetical protein